MARPQLQERRKSSLKRQSPITNQFGEVMKPTPPSDSQVANYLDHNNSNYVKIILV